MIDAVASSEDLAISLDRRSPIPLYHQLSTRIEGAILDGTLPAGAKLENELMLAERTHLSRQTVRQAIQQLVEKGHLVRARGVGTRVVRGTDTRETKLSGVFDDMRTTGQSVTTKLLNARRSTASPAEARGLVCDVGDSVLRIQRLRFADSTPVAILQNTLPHAFSDIDLDRVIRQGLYSVLQERGAALRVAKQHFGARGATADEARLLGTRAGHAVLTTTRTALAAGGQVVEFGRHIYRPDLYAMEVTIVG